MPVYNADIASILNDVADLLEMEGEDEYRVRAYRSAARTIATLSRDVSEMVEEGDDLTELSGIGEDLAGKIREIVDTGDLKQLEEIEQRTPPELSKMLNADGLGQKRVQTIYEDLGVTTIDELRDAAERGRIRDLHGLGPRTEQKILTDLRRVGAAGQGPRTWRDVAEERVSIFSAILEGSAG